MVDIKIHIPEELNKKFREVAMKKYGYTKGSLSIAAQRALEKWTYDQVIREKVKDIAKRTTKDAVDEIEGLLAHVKGKTSVELQHEAAKYRKEMAMSYKKKDG